MNKWNEVSKSGETEKPLLFQYRRINCYTILLDLNLYELSKPLIRQMNKWNEVSKYASLRNRETIDFLIKFNVEEENWCNILLDLNL
jgi:hypothetical protein